MRSQHRLRADVFLGIVVDGIAQRRGGFLAALLREPEERVAANVTAQIVPFDVDERVRAGRIQRKREQRAVIRVIGTAVRDALQKRQALAIADVVDPADRLSGRVHAAVGRQESHAIGMTLAHAAVYSRGTP